MGLPAGAVIVELADRQAALLDHQPGPRSIRGEPGLDLRLVIGPRLGRERQMVRGLAGLDPRGTAPRAREDGMDRPTHAQVTGDLRDPAGQALRCGLEAGQPFDRC